LRKTRKEQTEKKKKESGQGFVRGTAELASRTERRCAQNKRVKDGKENQELHRKNFSLLENTVPLYKTESRTK